MRSLLLLLTPFVLVGIAATSPLAAQECTYSVSPVRFDVPATQTGGITRTLQVNTSRGGCPWTSRSNVEWITVSFGQSGTNDGTVGIRVDDNKDAVTRSGSLTIAGQTIPVLQAAANCTFALNPQSAIANPGGGTGSFQVQTTCNWRAETGVEWIDVTAPAGGRGTGTGSVAYMVRANTSAAGRTGTIVVGALRFTVQQQAASCTQTLNHTQVSLPATGGTGTIQVTSGCAWSAVASVPWIVINAGTAGDGNGTVSYSVQANSDAAARSGTIRIGSQTFTVTQAGSGCAVTLTPSSANVGAAGGTGTLAVASTCAWTAASNAPWLSVTQGASGMGNGTVGYSASANTTGSPRTAAIAVGDKSFTVSQAAAGCGVTLSPPGARVAARGATGSFLVSAQTQCGWTATPRATWLSVTNGTGLGSGTVLYTAEANAGPERTGAIDVNGQAFTVTQAASTPVFTAAGVLNAASFTGGAVAPGLIVTIFGSDLGPGQLAIATVDPVARAFPTEIAGTAVLFDGVRAPLLYVSSTQLSAVAPFGVAGREVTRVEVETGGVRSAAVTIPVAITAPAIFTQAASGSGPGAILNQDFSVNSPANPAAPGSFVFVFATGGGVVSPASADGQLTTSAPATRATVTAEIDGQAAAVAYAGGAPDLIAGVLQVNLRVPANARPGDLPLTIRAGGAASQPNVTVSVR